MFSDFHKMSQAFDVVSQKAKDHFYQLTGEDVRELVKLSDDEINSKISCQLTKLEQEHSLKEIGALLQDITDWNLAMNKEHDRLKGKLQFSDYVEAARVAYITKDLDCELNRLAMLAVLEMAPPEWQQAFDEKLMECFPELVPTHHDGKGKSYFRLDSVADALGMSPGEIIDSCPPAHLTSSDEMFEIPVETH